MGVVWTFLNSNVGMLVVGSILSAIFVKSVKSKSRRERLLEYAREAFELAEMTGIRAGLKGNAKYLVYIEELVKMLEQNHEDPLSADERKTIEALARREAIKGTGTLPKAVVVSNVVGKG